MNIENIAEAENLEQTADEIVLRTLSEKIQRLEHLVVKLERDLKK